MRIAVLATGVGNVRSVVRALERALDGRARPTMTAEAADVRAADVLVVPGQGSFGAFASALEGGGLRDALSEKIASGAPYLGICLGLQALFETSEEAPGARGLGVLRGPVRRLAPGIDPHTGQAWPLPHVGWNLAAPRREGIVRSTHYYFAHTYAAVPDDASVILATTSYGQDFACAVARDNVVGVQFHPEKSQRAGLAFVERFFDAVVHRERALS